MDDLVIRQQQEIETLRERVRQLEDALVPPSVRVPLEWLLTGSEARLFAFLTTRDVATKAAIMQAIYSPGVDDEPEPKIVDVFVCKMRKKLKPFGVSIETVWGQGYALQRRSEYQTRIAA
ncbi:winged helix family transcriptional regulator [Mesorhizobium sp. B1-1-4]|uniref:helix-turn-helix domain-containing protein n=1 Tax=Mesorhizobium sp. B1-1-4 TaxID=2589980 RepID=UPI001125F290|nr:helix-turn-helix domain-containing protein [Mesorhizobium sp. B1-1-4]TPN44433.1 winged helix family transcriptional regulator [Mesorhizobium sp. B1-1-4]